MPTNGFSTLWVLTIGVLLAIIFEFLMKLVRAHMVDRASKTIDIEFSSVFFGKALDIRAESRPSTVGTFASQIRHFESVRNFMTSTTLFILADAPFTILYLRDLFACWACRPCASVHVASWFSYWGFNEGAIEQYAAETMEESIKKMASLLRPLTG